MFKKVILNIENKVDRCMEYYLLAALHYKKMDGINLVHASTWKPLARSILVSLLSNAMHW